MNTRSIVGGEAPDKTTDKADSISSSQSKKKDELTEQEKVNLEHYATSGGRGIFVCRSCGQVFVSMARFRKHLSEHSEDFEIECRHCGKPFANHALLAEHTITAHTVSKTSKNSAKKTENKALKATLPKPVSAAYSHKNKSETAKKNCKQYSCPACHESFVELSDLSSHTVAHKDITFLQCTTCELLFTTQADFSDHLHSKCSPESDRNLVCDLCKTHFTTLSEHSQHKCEPLSTSEKTCKNQSGKFLCADCGVLFRLERMYILHLIKHTVNKAKGLEHTELMCQTCQHVFPSKRALTKHMQIHALSHESHPCSKCDDVFSSKRALVSHQKKHISEADSSTFTCQFCNMSFLSQQDLNVHIRSSHSDIRPFACDQCDASFKAKFDLIRHKLKHEGKKFYVCGYCGRDFYAKEDLKQHEAAVHSATPRAKPFMCHECGKTFFRRGHLNTHRRSHSSDRPFICPECPVKCKTKKNLEVHMRHHRGELPIMCRVCGMGFVDHCYLARHMVRHKPAPDLHCHLCHKAFYHQQHLKAHISAIHFVCFNCDQMFADKREIKLHRRDCQFPSAALYLKRPGVMSSPSAVVVEPVNPGGNMLASSPVEGSSNFADTLAPTPGPDPKDPHLFPEVASVEVSTREEDAEPSPFGHYNADTNTVIIYEDQLRWAKNTVSPNTGGSCTYEISIPGENFGETTKLIIEDKTGDAAEDNTLGDLGVLDVSQEEEVSAIGNKTPKLCNAVPQCDHAQYSWQRLMSKPVVELHSGEGTSVENLLLVPSAEHADNTHLSNALAAFQPELPLEPALTASLAEGLETTMYRMQLKDLTVSLVNLNQALQKFDRDAADETAHTAESDKVAVCRGPSHQCSKSIALLEDSALDLILDQNNAPTGTSLAFSGAEESEQLEGDVMVNPNDTFDLSVTNMETSADSAEVTIFYGHQKPSNRQEIIGENYTGEDITNPDHSQSEVGVTVAPIPSKQTAELTDKISMFKCCHCQRLFATRVAALTHVCDMANKKKSPAGLSEISTLSTSPAKLPASYLSMPSSSVVSSSVSHLAVSQTPPSSVPWSVTYPVPNRDRGPQIITISSTSPASTILSKSVSLLPPDLKQLSAVKKISMTQGVLPVPVSPMELGKGNESAGQTRAVSLLAPSATLTSGQDNIQKLSHQLSDTGDSFQNPGKIMQETSETPEPSQTATAAEYQPAVPQVRTLGQTKFKCFICGELFSTMEAVVAHTPTHGQKPTSTKTSNSTSVNILSGTGQISTTRTSTLKPKPTFSADKNLDNTNSVLISLPAQDTKTMCVISLPGNPITARKKGRKPKTRPSDVMSTDKETFTKHPDHSLKSFEAGEKSVMKIDAPQQPLQTVPAADGIKSASTKASRSENFGISSGSPLLQDDLANLDLPSYTVRKHNRCSKIEKSKPQTIPAVRRKSSSVKSAKSFTEKAVESKNQEQGSSQIAFACNECSEHFSTVAAFAAHAKKAHPKLHRKRPRPGRVQSTWKKHKQRWDEIEKSTVIKHSAGNAAASKPALSKRKPPNKDFRKPSFSQSPSEQTTTRSPQTRKQQAKDAIKRMDSTIIREEGPPSVPETMRARMSVLELAAAAEVVEDAMWQLDRPYQCDVCEESFSYMQQISQHLISAHQRHELYKCSHCVGVFSSLSSLTLHFQKHAQLSAQNSSPVAMQQSGCTDAVGKQNDGQGLVTPRRRTRSSSASVSRQRLSSLTDLADVATTVTPRPKDRKRYLGGLTLESLADAAVALAERGEKLSVDAQSMQVVASKSMWEASYTIGDQTFTISVAVPPPEKLSLHETHTKLTRQSGQVGSVVGSHTLQDSIDKLSSALQLPPCDQQSQPQVNSQSPTKSFPVELSDAAGNDITLSSATRVLLFSSESLTMLQDKQSLSSIKTRRSNQEQAQSAVQNSALQRQEGMLTEHSEGILTSVYTDHDSDSISIHSDSGDGDDENITVLSMAGRQTEWKPSTSTQTHTKSVTPSKVQTGLTSRKRRLSQIDGLLPSKDRLVAKALVISKPTAQPATPVSMTTRSSSRKLTQREELPACGQRSRKATANSKTVTALESEKSETLQLNPIGHTATGSVNSTVGCRHKRFNTSRSSGSSSAVETSESQQPSSTSFRCEICHTSFTSKTLLDTHVLSHKSTHGTYTCTSCMREFISYAHLVTHLLQHVSGLSFHCGLCRAAFNHYAALHAHQRTHNSPGAGGHLLCTLCGLLLPSKALLASHWKECHCSSTQQEGSEDLKSTAFDPAIKSDDSEGDDMVSVDDVKDSKKAHGGEKKYPENIDAENNAEAEDARTQAQVRNESVNQRQLDFKKKKPVCSICNRSFSSNQYLRFHMQSHSERPRCAECGKTFMHEVNLRSHIKRHRTVQAFRCITCGKVYRDKDSLRYHEKIHKGLSTSRYTCPVCGQPFRNRKDMEYHKEGHDANKNRPMSFVCTVCGKAFSRQTYMNTHFKRCHSQVNDKHFACSICDMVLTSKYLLYNHERRHVLEKKRHICEVCSKQFCTIAALEHHKFVHSGKFPFLCQVCGKGFMVKRSLIEHETSHPELTKHYCCEVCGKKIKSKAGLATHLKSHYKDVDTITLETPRESLTALDSDLSTEDETISSGDCGILGWQSDDAIKTVSV